MPEHPYLQWPVFRRSVVAAFDRSLTVVEQEVQQFLDASPDPLDVALRRR
jgi:hypothetical protein